MSQHWDERDDEGVAMYLKTVKGEDPWECRRKNTLLWCWIAVSLTVNLIQTIMLVALLRVR